MEKDNFIKNKSFTPKDETERKKLEFFWNRCTPASDDVVDSIREKTFRKIYAGSQNKQLVRIEKSYKKLYISVASVAAAFLLIFAGSKLFYIEQQPDDIKNIAKVMPSVAVDSVKDITLIMSETKNIELKEDATVAYTSTGSVSVDSKLISREEGSEKVKLENSVQKYNQLIVPNGKRAQLLLADGTKLWVNSGSKVVYPCSFKGKTREIFVEGEAYFEVAHDADRPFIVNTAGFDVKVLGTTFNICAYTQLPTGLVALVEGAVEIKDRHDGIVKMKPNELVSIVDEGIKEKTVVNASDYAAWINGCLILNGERLTNLVDRLSVYYGKKIVCDESFREEQLYGKLNLRDDLYEIIDFVKKMIPTLSVHENEGIIYLRRE